MQQYGMVSDIATYLHGEQFFKCYMELQYLGRLFIIITALNVCRLVILQQLV